MKSQIFLAFVLVLSQLFSFAAQAYMEVGESAEIQPQGKFKAGFIPQFKLSDGSGMNFSGFFDSGLSEATSFRLHLGGGDLDFFGGGSFKWVPIPDYDKQPAIGGKVEAIYGREGSESLATFRVMPLISKKFSTDHGEFVPYGAFPISLTTYKGSSDTQLHLVGGTEWRHPNTPNMEFGAELGLNANKSFSYLSFLVTLLMDDSVKVRGRR